jgi:cold shock CspA family protein
MQRTGTVKSFSDARGFGFLLDPRSGKDVFVHVNNFIDPTLRLVSGMQVQFVLGSANGKSYATQVRSLEK